MRSIKLPQPTPDQMEYLERIRASGEDYDASTVIGSPRVFRVQDREGRGPFKPGFSKMWCDDDFAPGQENLPTFLEEFGFDIIDRLGKPGEYYGSAVRTIAEICRWFSATERARLASLDYNIVSLRANRILAESKNQLLIARRAPLANGAIIVSWPQ